MKFQYQDLYNIPQTAFDEAMQEGEIENVESEEENEQELEVEFETEKEYIAADSESDEDLGLNSDDNVS